MVVVVLLLAEAFVALPSAAAGQAPSLSRPRTWSVLRSAATEVKRNIISSGAASCGKLGLATRFSPFPGRCFATLGLR